MKETKLTIEELKELQHVISSYVNILCSLDDSIHIDGCYEEQLKQLSTKLSIMVAQKIYMGEV